MKIFLICSRKFYHRVPEILGKIEQNHEITLPNSYEDPTAEEKHKALSAKEHATWKAGMLRHSADVIAQNDAVLVLNFDKGDLKNYLGGATFLEMYEAFKLGKKIFLYNDIPEGILHDEIRGFEPILLEGDFARIA